MQAHIGNLASSPVADFIKPATGGEFVQAYVGNLGKLSSGRFHKICNGGVFCKHI